MQTFDETFRRLTGKPPHPWHADLADGSACHDRLVRIPTGPGIGLTGNVTLLFERSVAGPLLLGRTRYFGGGLFRPVEEPEQP